MKSKLAPILLVVANALEAEYFQRVFRSQGFKNPLQVATSPSQALDMLRGTRPPAPASVPRLILLVVASAASGCLGFLKELRQDPALKASSVFVLSSQPSAQNLQEAYELNVAGFIKNPLGLESLAGGIATLHAFWNLMELPN